MTDFKPRAIRWLTATRPNETVPSDSEAVEIAKAFAWAVPERYQAVIATMSAASNGQFPDARIAGGLFDLEEMDGTPIPARHVPEYVFLNLMEGRISDELIDNLAQYRAAHEVAGPLAITETVPAIIARRSAETRAEARTKVKGS